MTETPTNAAREPVAPPTVAAPEPTSRFAAARATALSLARSAPVARYGLFGIGLLAFVENIVLTRFSDPPMALALRLRTEINASVALLSYLLAGWLVGCLLQAAAHALDLLVAQWETTTQLGESIERLALIDWSVAATVEAATTGGRDRALAEIRLAIETARWPHAEALCRAFNETYPADPEGQRLASQLDEARRGAAESIRARIDAARKINDPEMVIDLRDALAQLVHVESLRELDRELAKWFMDLIQKRLRSGTMAADVALLAGRLAESLDHTVEGASLRSALPTLRRSAGLCARCGEPYKGIADACPKCLASASIIPFNTTLAPAPEPEDDGRAGDEESDIFSDLDI